MYFELLYWLRILAHLILTILSVCTSVLSVHLAVVPCYKTLVIVSLYLKMNSTRHQETDIK